MENNNIKLIMGILIGAIVSASLALAAVLLLSGGTVTPASVPAAVSGAHSEMPVETVAVDTAAGLELLIDGEAAPVGDDGVYHIKLDNARAAQSLVFKLTGQHANTMVTYYAAFADTNTPLEVEIVSPGGILNTANITGDGKFAITARAESDDSTAEETVTTLEIAYPIHVTGVFYNGNDITDDTVALDGEEHVFTWSAEADGTVSYSCELYETGAQEPVQSADGMTEGRFEINGDVLSYGHGYELRFAASVTGEDGQTYEARPVVITPELSFGFFN